MIRNLFAIGYQSECMAVKENIIEDILNWKQESELTGGAEFDYADTKADLESRSQAELETYWRGTVGEWIASRDDVHRRFEEQVDAGEFEGDFEDFIEFQLKKVKAGKETDYGYL